MYPGAHGARRLTVTKPSKPTLGGFFGEVSRGSIAGEQSGPTGRSPHPYMMHMLGRGQWVRQGSMRGDARVSGEYATKGLVGERINVVFLNFSP